MTTSQPFLARFRRPGAGGRSWLGIVMAFALALRLLVPQGWMPSPTGGLMLCPGTMPAAHATPMHHGENAPGHVQPDHPCAFAGLGLAAAPVPPLVAPRLPAAVADTPAPFAHTVAIGRGLAAPPPPATGPPAFA